MMLKKLQERIDYCATRFALFVGTLFIVCAVMLGAGAVVVGFISWIKGG